MKVSKRDISNATEARDSAYVTIPHVQEIENSNASKRQSFSGLLGGISPLLPKASHAYKEQLAEANSALLNKEQGSSAQQQFDLGEKNSLMDQTYEHFAGVSPKELSDAYTVAHIGKLEQQRGEYQRPLEDESIQTPMLELSAAHYSPPYNPSTEQNQVASQNSLAPHSFLNKAQHGNYQERTLDQSQKNLNKKLFGDETLKNVKVDSREILNNQIYYDVSGTSSHQADVQESLNNQVKSDQSSRNGQTETQTDTNNRIYFDQNNNNPQMEAHTNLNNRVYNNIPLIETTGNVDNQGYDNPAENDKQNAVAGSSQSRSDVYPSPPQDSNRILSYKSEAKNDEAVTFSKSYSAKTYINSNNKDVYTKSDVFSISPATSFFNEAQAADALHPPVENLNPAEMEKSVDLGKTAGSTHYIPYQSQNYFFYADRGSKKSEMPSKSHIPPNATHPGMFIAHKMNSKKVKNDHFSLDKVLFF